MLCENIIPGIPRLPVGQNTMAGPEWIWPRVDLVAGVPTPYSRRSPRLTFPPRPVTIRTAHLGHGVCVVLKSGANGFDWITVGRGGVPWLISGPR